jgi:DNA-binding transcriptional LysR family regulator
MELRHLRYFVAAVEEGSLHGAAERMNVAQPALSRRIRDFEAELGCELLARGVKGVTPTPAGAALYRETILLLQGLETAAERTRRLGLAQGGVARLGLVHASRRYDFVHAAIAAFSTDPAQPGVALTRNLSPELSAALREDRLDMTLLFENRLGALGLGERTVHRERYVLAAHPNHRLAAAAPLTLTELAGQPMVWLSRRGNPDNYDALMQQCRLHGLEPLIAHVAANHDEQLDVTMAIGGVCLTPAATVRSTREDALAFRPIPGFEMGLPLSFAWRPDLRTASARRLLELFHAAIDDHQAAIRSGQARWTRLLGHEIVRLAD